MIRESGQFVGDVLASLVNFYNPEMIVIGGGVSNLGNLLLSSIGKQSYIVLYLWQLAILKSFFRRLDRMQV